MAEEGGQAPATGEGQGGAPAFGGATDTIKSLLAAASKRGDIVFAIGLVLLLVILIMPMPTWLLDISLALSLTFSVLILMTAVFIGKAVEFNVFPMVLLIATLFRLALNLASTRLILGHGHEGTDAAGKVIEAFGGFLMVGNPVIGVIVFAILVLVNFIVITKGATRIAEVAARFTLDAMPGKQMAIDADLSAGLIDEAEAKARRVEMQAEADFFGSMDGASKFVRGDAIAGLLITVINIIGGMIIGMAQQDMSFSDAVNTFTALTVGDGPGVADSGPDRFGRRRYDGVQGRPAGHRRPRLVRPVVELSQGARHGFVPHRHLGPAARPARPAVPVPGGGHRRHGLLPRPQPQGDRGPRAGDGGEAGQGDRNPGGRGADLDGAEDRPAAPRTGLRPVVADQQSQQGAAADRPDQGPAPGAGDRDGFRHAQRAHPGQHAAFGQQLRALRQGRGGRARRPAAQHAAGDGPEGRGNLDPRREDHRTDLRLARRVGRAAEPRGSAVPRLHRGRSADRGHHPSDRDRPRIHVPSCCPTPRPRSCSTSWTRSIRSWSAT